MKAVETFKNKMVGQCWNIYSWCDIFKL